MKCAAPRGLRGSARSSSSKPAESSTVAGDNYVADLPLPDNPFKRRDGLLGVLALVVTGAAGNGPGTSRPARCRLPNSPSTHLLLPVNSHVAVDVTERAVGSEVEHPAGGLDPAPLVGAFGDLADQVGLTRDHLDGSTQFCFEGF